LFKVNYVLIRDLKKALRRQYGSPASLKQQFLCFPLPIVLAFF